MNNTPSSNRKHIGLFGRRNTGKSSLMNALLGQDYSIVSDVAGTTTDAVSKAYELQPIGPVVFHDTAGIDDDGKLGSLRVAKTKSVLEKVDIALLVTDSDEPTQWETELVSLFKEMKTPWIHVRNKWDLKAPGCESGTTEGIINISCAANYGIDDLKAAIAAKISASDLEIPLISDLVHPPDTVVLVIPIDKEAPKGRLILPQVQVMRELLDSDVSCVIVKEKELPHVLTNVLKEPPSLVVTDSQVFLKVSGDVPLDIRLTGFSVLFARAKGDLRQYILGLKAIDKLKDGAKILIAESCSHRPVSEDIGRVKIPRWLRQYTGLDLIFDIAAGHDFPDDLSPYSLVIQCGGCMVTRKTILSRLERCKKQQVPVVNYGLTIAFLHGIIERALSPFPDILEEYLHQ